MTSSNLDAIKKQRNGRRRRSGKPNNGGQRDPELQEILQSISILDIVRRDTGEQGKISGDHVDFKLSPWGTHDSLTVYPKTNSFKEFSSNHESGGTLIDYYMKRDNCNRSAAIDLLRSEAGRPRQKKPQPIENRPQPMPEGDPQIKPLQLANLPERSPELIENVLRRGHKMIVQAPSKAGKTWLMVELVLSIATGTKWLGLKCTKGRVLYCNFEVDDVSFLHRCKMVADDLCLDYEECTKNVDVWGLRGAAESMEAFTPKLISLAKKGDYSAIIFDPVYKLMNGADENSAGEIGAFCNQIDRITRDLGCSVIYAHHHSKGNKADTNAIDRGSGSGVFARDPDAIIDLLQLFAPTDEEDLDGDQTVWRVSTTLREFPPMKPFIVSLSVPIHVPDLINAFENWEPYRPQQSGGKIAGKMKQAKAEAEAWQTVAQVAAYFTARDNPEEGFDINDLEAALDIDRRTLKKRLSKCIYFDVANPSRNKCIVVPTTETMNLGRKVAKP